MREISVNGAIKEIFGSGVSIVSKSPVSGGDINSAYCLMLSDGNRVFMKGNARRNADFFRAEKEGLDAIKKTQAIPTPDILSSGIDGDMAFLLLSYAEPGRPAAGMHERFGINLARMHAADTTGMAGEKRFGFTSDNYIGAGFQKNTPKDSFIEFFAECRLRVQFERASEYFDTSEIKDINAFLDRLDKYLIEPDHPSLLHGDLWGGNYITGPDGEAWLIDPAAYVGHFEADLAMTELFGGFRDEFYRAYFEVSPCQPGYGDRRDIYNLYHLLNHLNLFGAGYLSSVKGIVRRYV